MEEKINNIEDSIQKIDMELMNVFSERRIELLKLLKSILEEEKDFFMEGIVLYGTRSFYMFGKLFVKKYLEMIRVIEEKFQNLNG